MNPRRVQKDDLGIVVISYTEDSVPCRLRLVGDNGEFGADEPIQERRFSGIRTADERNETGLQEWPPV
jgi:hypothetical protein